MQLPRVLAVLAVLTIGTESGWGREITGAGVSIERFVMRAEHEPTLKDLGHCGSQAVVFQAKGGGLNKGICGQRQGPA